jgi:arylsulfatase A-like enzyme
MAPRNIVVLMVDDMSMRMLVDMPNLSNLVIGTGVTLSNYLISQPLCAPSRASFLRGQYAQNTGINENKHGTGMDAVYAIDIWRGDPIGTGPEASTLATWFQDAQYRTGMVGKYLNGYGETLITPEYYTPPGWDYFVGVGGDAGDAQNYWLWNNGTFEWHGTGDENYLTRVLSAKAVTFIEDAITAEDPFFLMVTPKAPHHPADHESQYASLYTTENYPTGLDNPAFNETDVTDKPDWIYGQGALGPLEVSQIHYYFKRKLRALKSVDDMVGALMTALEPVMDDTYFVFCSDNGFHTGEHQLGHGNDFGGKNTIYEEDIRVPCFITGGDIVGPIVVDKMIGNIDMAPTLCALAEEVTPDEGVEIDGRSFAPFLTGGNVDPWRKYFLLTRDSIPHKNFGFRADYINGEEEVVKFTFGEYTAEQVHNQGEYYNLDPEAVNGDPYQLNSTYNGLGLDLGPLQIKLTALKGCSGDSCRTAENTEI